MRSQAREPEPVSGRESQASGGDEPLPWRDVMRVSISGSVVVQIEGSGILGYRLFAKFEAQVAWPEAVVNLSSG